MQKRNEKGVALIMVLTAIMILTALWGDFTFDSKLSRIKTTNVMDRSQAKLLAESALELAMTRLRMYKEAFNTWSRNPDAKNMVSIQLLNQIWELPFFYPLPIPPEAGAQVKASIDDFKKSSLLEGEFKLSIQNMSSRLNLNMLRLDILNSIPDMKTNADGIVEQPPVEPDDQQKPPDDKDPTFSVEQQLLNLLTLKITKKKEEDEEFEDKYGALEIPQLVANLKYYMSDKGSIRKQDTPIEMRFPEAEQSFEEAKITPKFGPMASMSELHLIPLWDDEIIDLIKDEFGVFPSVQIDLNKITDSMLRLLIPNISEDDIKLFFEYRDNPENPHYINSLEQFKNYIVTIANLMSDTNFDERFNKFSAQGITFGPAPTLFKVTAEGTYNRATYTIVATVSLPSVQQAPQQPAATQPETPKPTTPNTNDPSKPPTQPAAAAQNTQLQDPRVIEILLN
jgi:hypothetical protein